MLVFCEWANKIKARKFVPQQWSQGILRLDCGFWIGVFGWLEYLVF